MIKLLITLALLIAFWLILRVFDDAFFIYAKYPEKLELSGKPFAGFRAFWKYGAHKTKTGERNQ